MLITGEKVFLFYYKLARKCYSFANRRRENIIILSLEKKVLFFC